MLYLILILKMSSFSINYINVATNVAKPFFTLIQKHFPTDKKIKQNIQ